MSNQLQNARPVALHIFITLDLLTPVGLFIQHTLVTGKPKQHIREELSFFFFCLEYNLNA